LKIKPGVAFKLRGDGLVQVNGYLHTASFGCNNHARLKIVVLISKRGLDGIRSAVYGTRRDGRNQVPLLWCVGKPHRNTLCSSGGVVNQFYAGVLFIIDPSGEKIIVHKDIDTPRLEILQIIEGQILAPTFV